MKDEKINLSNGQEEGDPRQKTDVEEFRCQTRGTDDKGGSIPINRKNTRVSMLNRLKRGLKIASKGIRHAYMSVLQKDRRICAKTYVGAVVYAFQRGNR